MLRIKRSKLVVANEYGMVASAKAFLCLFLLSVRFRVGFHVGGTIILIMIDH